MTVALIVNLRCLWFEIRWCDIARSATNRSHNIELLATGNNQFNSPLSKRVETWGEGERAFNYGIVWGRTRICFQLVRPQTILLLSARSSSPQNSTLFESGLFAANVESKPKSLTFFLFFEPKTFLACSIIRLFIARQLSVMMIMIMIMIMVTTIMATTTTKPLIST